MAKTLTPTQERQGRELAKEYVGSAVRAHVARRMLVRMIEDTKRRYGVDLSAELEGADTLPHLPGRIIRKIDAAFA